MKRNNGIAYMIGTGLALSPIHNQWLTNLFTSDGQVSIFLPSIGLALWLVGALLFVTWHWPGIKSCGFGDKKIWIPLVIIVAGIGLSGLFTGNSVGDKMAPLLMGCAMFTLYLTARVLGTKILFPMAIGVYVAMIGVFAYAALNPTTRSGGFIFEGNYDIIVGYILIVVAIFDPKHRWILAGLSILALMLTGSPEAVFVLAILAIVVIIRRDWSKKLLYALIPVIAVGVLLFSTGHLQTLYRYTYDIAVDNPIVSQNGDEKIGIGQRLTVIKEAIRNTSVFGDGYSVTEFNKKTVHNVPLIIVQQLGIPGIMAALSWLWVSLYALIKTKWKYVWVCILALSVFDHFIWTQLAPWWWLVLGVTSNTAIGNDLIFKGKEG